MRVFLSLLLVLAASILPAVAQPAPRVVTVSLTYRERIALPPGSRAVVEVIAAGSQVAAREEIALNGRQVPVPARVAVDPMRLPQDAALALRGTLTDPSGNLRWTGSKPLRFAPDGAPTDLGTLILTRAAAGATAETRTFAYQCGAERVTARFDGAALHLRVAGGQEQRLRQVRSASGARYANGVGLEALTFWDRGAQALLIRGDDTVECTRLEPDTYRARGREPGWSLSLAPERLVLELDDGAQRVVTPLPAREVRDNVTHLAVRTEAHDLRVAIAPGPCRNGVDSLPYPDRVTLELDGRVLNGCGGDPAALLQGDAWTVDRIGDMAIGTDPAVTIAFDAEGRVTGRGPCNSFGGGYGIGEEGLVLGPIAATMRMCPSPAMEREAALFSVLKGTVPFDISADGVLTIGRGANMLRARRGEARQ